MDRDQAKKMLREQLETDLSLQESHMPVIPVKGQYLSARQIMEEVDKGTELGDLALDDFIFFVETGVIPLTEEERLEVADLMQQDVDRRSAAFATTTVEAAQGLELTPNEIIRQVREGTTFGRKYANDWAKANLTLVKVNGNTSTSKPSLLN